MKIIEKTANTTTVVIAGSTVLFSYKTPVAALIPGRGYVKTDEFYSRTTCKHIGQFGANKAEVVPQSFITNLAEGK